MVPEIMPVGRDRGLGGGGEDLQWIPDIAVWDATLRMVAAEAQVRRTFKPGSVLDDEVIGLTSSGA